MSEVDPHTLAIDIGGTGLKATVLDPKGEMLVDRVRVETPHPCPPPMLVDHLVQLVEPLPAYDRISVGFPGVVRRGRTITAPHFGNELFHDFPLGEELSRRLGKPLRMLNDAEVQGLGVIEGRGLEFVLTLGTGAGTAVFREGEVMAHLELAQHPIHNGKTYDEYLGDAEFERIGIKKWRRHVGRAIETIRVLVNFDHLYIGGGNAKHVEDVPKDVSIVSNEAGLTGGVKLWSVNYP
jgi:polyphosphate glucokinase